MENQLVLIRADELKNLIDQSVSHAVSKMPQNKVEDEILLRRKDVSKLFSVSLVTINKWMKSGKLTYHRVNSRIYFKKSEVLEALQSPPKQKRSCK